MDLRQRLLELFPVASLRAGFASKGSKDEIARKVAMSSRASGVDALVEFLDVNIGFCKQHTHVFYHDGLADLPDTIQNAELIRRGNSHALFLARIEYKVVKLNPLENDSIEFLWPIRVEMHQNYLVARFVVLEKNIGSYFDREVLVHGKSLSEKAITSGFLADGTVTPADLNKGFKTLWHQDQIDAARVKYKKPGSVVTQSMDEARGLKQFDRDAYEELSRLPLHQSIFIPYRSFADVGKFTANPTDGFIGFTRYFREGASGDELIRQILEKN